MRLLLLACQYNTYLILPKESATIPTGCCPSNVSARLTDFNATAAKKSVKELEKIIKKDNCAKNSAVLVDPFLRDILHIAACSCKYQENSNIQSNQVFFATKQAASIEELTVLIMMEILGKGSVFLQLSGWLCV